MKSNQPYIIGTNMMLWGIMSALVMLCGRRMKVEMGTLLRGLACLAGIVLSFVGGPAAAIGGAILFPLSSGEKTRSFALILLVLGLAFFMGGLAFVFVSTL